MRDQSTTVESWLRLAHPDLTEHVRQAVRGGSAAAALWSDVATHPVLAARVRGILSALDSQMADHRDHAMWTMWINRARRALVATPLVETSSPARPAPAAQRPAVDLTTPEPPRRRAHAVTPVMFLAADQESVPSIS